MGFSTNIFLFVFFPVFLLIYGISSTKCRPYILLFFSVIFYIWGSVKGSFVIGITAFVNYILGFLIAGSEGQRRKWITRISVSFNLLILICFKYMDFFAGTISRLSGRTFEVTFFRIIYPLGVSYFSFSAISYLIDIYRNEIKHEEKFHRFLLYMLMFPKITAGPIVRYKDLYSQLDCQKVSLKKSAEGARRFCIGLAKKVLIADQLGAIVDQIFSASPAEHLVSVAWLGAVCYMLQIYHDFSGYSDMAIGIGKICGFDFKENFNYPYISRSLTEFWRRWHISLSSWFRDYLYIPLGGNRRGNIYVNLSIVFLATGIWHGGEWHFVLWGIWNGVFLLFEKLLKRHCRVKAPDWLRILYTLIVVLLGWVFFRCGSVSMGIHYILKLFGIGRTAAGFAFHWYWSARLVLVIAAGILSCVPWKSVLRIKKQNMAVEYAVCLILLFLSILVVMSSTYNSFIYFKF